MFQEEARFGRISQTRTCGCPKPLRPLVKAMVIQEYTYAYAAVSPSAGLLEPLILPSVNSACMQVFVDEIAHRHPDENILRGVMAQVGIVASCSTCRAICNSCFCLRMPQS